MARKKVGKVAEATEAVLEGFEMHPRMLWDIMTQQAGTLQKAILEGVMNAIDAGSSRCDITIDRKSFTIRDDGKGFVDETEIKKFFKTFGYPHEKGDADYGRYRMGRGQLFSFGVNRWSSNEFRMDVDLKPQKETVDEQGIGYWFSQGHEHLKGCVIEVDLYENLLPSELDATIREITDFVRWAQIPVTVNGKQVNQRPSEAKWDVETDDAYVTLSDRGSLDVYNLGVLVCRIPSYRYGTGGTIVSKRQLDVNFARNDIQSTCEEWKRIQKHLRASVTAETVRKPSLNDAERENLATQIRTGDLSLAEAMKIRLVTDVTGTQHRLQKLTDLRWGYQNALSAAPRQDRVGERAHTRGLAFVVAEETLDRFGVDSIEAFVGLLKDTARAEGEHDPYGQAVGILRAMEAVEIVPRAEFEKIISVDYEPLSEKDLKPAERIAIKAIQDGLDVMQSNIRHSNWIDVISPNGRETWKNRRVQAGVSAAADAWTDGHSNIWLERNLLPLVKQGIPGMVRIAEVLLHELRHAEADTGTHVHDLDFYKDHHDIACDTDCIGLCAQAIMASMIKLIRKEERKPTGALRKAEDNAAELDDASLDMAEPRTDSRLPEGDAAEPSVSGTADGEARLAARAKERKTSSRGSRAKAKATSNDDAGVSSEPMLPFMS